MKENPLVSSNLKHHAPFFPLHLLLMAVLAVCLLGSGCGYPEVSPQTYSLAKSLYSATNLKQTERLDNIETLIEESLSHSEITPREADYLRDILETARAGHWEDAQLESRALMEDQIGSSQPQPNQHTH